MANTYHIGQKVRLFGDFYDDTETLTDPTTVTFMVKEPNDTETAYVFGASTVVKDSVGKYHFDVTPNAADRWDYRITGVGNGVDAAKEDHFIARASAFTTP